MARAIAAASQTGTPRAASLRPGNTTVESPERISSTAYARRVNPARVPTYPHSRRAGSSCVARRRAITGSNCRSTSESSSTRVTDASATRTCPRQPAQATSAAAAAAMIARTRLAGIITLWST